jgi:hypothetical protein
MQPSELKLVARLELCRTVALKVSQQIGAQQQLMEQLRLGARVARLDQILLLSTLMIQAMITRMMVSTWRNYKPTLQVAVIKACIKTSQQHLAPESLSRFGITSE